MTDEEKPEGLVAIFFLEGVGIGNTESSKLVNPVESLPTVL